MAVISVVLPWEPLYTRSDSTFERSKHIPNGSNNTI